MDLEGWVPGGVVRHGLPGTPGRLTTGKRGVSGESWGVRGGAEKHWGPAEDAGMTGAGSEGSRDCEAGNSGWQ